MEPQLDPIKHDSSTSSRKQNAASPSRLPRPMALGRPSDVVETAGKIGEKPERQRRSISVQNTTGAGMKVLSRGPGQDGLPPTTRRRPHSFAMKAYGSMPPPAGEPSGQRLADPQKDMQAKPRSSHRSSTLPLSRSNGVEKTAPRSGSGQVTSKSKPERSSAVMAGVTDKKIQPLAQAANATTKSSSSRSSVHVVDGRGLARKPDGSSQDVAPRSQHSRAEAGASSSGRPSAEQKRFSRPSFSTLQQHYSPKKKAAEVVDRGVQSRQDGRLDDAEALDMMRAQTRLLQFHLLHSSADETSEAWRQSAKSTIHQRWRQLADACRDVDAAEELAQRELNLRALAAWDNDAVSGGRLEAKAHALSSALHEVLELSGPGGRYSRLREQFECWIEHVQDVWASRDRSVEDQDLLEEPRFVREVDGGWSGQIDSIARRLLTHERALPVARADCRGSSLARVMTSCRGLISGMLGEIYAMRELRQDAIARERQSIEAMASKLVRGVGPNDDENAISVSQPIVRRGAWAI